MYNRFILNINIKIGLKNACVKNLFDLRMKQSIDITIFYNLNKLKNNNDFAPYIINIKTFFKNNI